MTNSCVIYARYSSDNQSEHSIDDQLRICRARAEREGWQVVSVFTDYALSGASTLRPGYQQLLDLIRRGGADIVLAESLDRFSRDQEHIAGFFKQAQFVAAKIMTLAEGEVSELHIGLKGTMGALYLKDLADKTRRGQAGRIHAGGSAGGLSFGYRVRRGLRPDGSLISGEMDIDEDQAKIIRRVFGAYNAGQSPRSIAKELNVKDIPGPRGGKWSASLLLGSAKRETGLLRNRLYIGERVWDRQRWIKDPSTGKRVARQNPKEKWIVKHVPDLAVIDRTTWEGAQARLSASRQSVLQKEEPSSGEQQNLGRRLGALRRPKWPLAGLVRCGRCNGPMSVMGANGRLGCANHVERGTCDNPRTILRDRLLGRVLAGIKERLLAPDLVDQFVGIHPGSPTFLFR
jgi:DNA invertase Pin-like site-specific DNA recombinase